LSRKNKLLRFAENEKFDKLFQPEFREIFGKNYTLNGKWHEKVFNNNNPIILELGCGRGEYTVELARNNPDNNYIGIDIKGARLWKGAKTINQESLRNVAFIRTRIEFIDSFFSENEVSEIWITFPDPQLKQRRAKKRLTSAFFLNLYKKFLKENGIIHLKTDSNELFGFTLDLLRFNNNNILCFDNDIYSKKQIPDVLRIKTHYETKFLSDGKTIKYLSFLINKSTDYANPPEIDDKS